MKPLDQVTKPDIYKGKMLVAPTEIVAELLRKQYPGVTVVVSERIPVKGVKPMKYRGKL